MNIYIPYTYLIGWSEHNTFYYGRRTAKNCHPSEFWVKYFTSSREVKKFREEHGEPDIIQIRKTFPNNPDGCKLWESKFLERVDAQHNPKFLNKKNGDHKWDTTGMVTVRDSNKNTLQITKKQFESNNEFVGIATGYAIARTLSGDIIRTSKSDERFLSGELVGVTKNKIPVKDKSGKTFMIEKTDPRYISGELVHNSTGLVPVIGTDNKCYSITTEEFQDPQNDFIHPNKGKIVVEIDGETKQISKSDPNFVGGNYSSIYKNKIPVKHKETGKYYQVFSDDERYLSGELITIYKWNKLYKEGSL